MNDDFITELSVKQIRLIRHSFMNNLQVIYAYLQINKPDKAIDYIKEINKKIFGLSLIYNLDNPMFSLLMQDLIMEVDKLGVDYDIKTLLDSISDDLFTKNKIETIKIFDILKGLLSENLKKNNDSKKIQIDVENNESFLLSIYNTELKKELKSADNEIIYNHEGFKLISYNFGSSFLLELIYTSK